MILSTLWIIMMTVLAKASFIRTSLFSLPFKSL